MTAKISKIFLFQLLLYALIFLTACYPNRFVPNNDPSPICSVCVPEKIRVALVLGSGGVRGMAHVGVIEELKNAGIPIDLIVGCSAGSMVGALYADNPNIEEVKQIVWDVRTDSLLDLDLWNCRYGLSQGRSMRSALNKHLSAKTFEDLKIPLVVVATDLYSGELVPIGSGDLVNAVQASCSIPLMFVPCECMGRILIDGGVVNPVPANVARDLGAQVVISVDLCELLPKTFPSNLFQIATRSAEIAFMWQNDLCNQYSDVIIRPRTTGIGTFNDKMKWQIYQAGKRATREKIPFLKKILGENNLKDSTHDEKRMVHLHCYLPQIYVEDP
jgi:NTE family protein